MVPCSAVLFSISAVLFCLEQSPSWETNSASSNQRTPPPSLNFIGTRRSITASTSTRHLFLSWARSIQSMLPHPISWRPLLILSSHPRLGFPSGIFPLGFPTKTLHVPPLSPYVPHALQPCCSWCDRSNSIWGGVQIVQFLILQSPPVPSVVALRSRCVPQFCLV